MTDVNGQKAGGIILRDLELFNRAAIFMEQAIEPLIHSRIDGFFKEWAEVCGWDFDGAGEDDFEELWVAPPQWRVDAEDWFAWFQMGRREGHSSNSYQIADLFGVGQTEFGLRFRVGHSHFGGKMAWNAFSHTIGEFGQRLGERGWAYEGKGAFFRPLVLPAALVSQAWESDDWAPTLEPLEKALNSLIDDVSVFDALLTKAKASTI